MSRIGRMPVSVPSGVDVKIDGTTVTVKGPKGTLTKTFVKGMGIAFENNEIIVTRPNEEKESKCMHAIEGAIKVSSDYNFGYKQSEALVRMIRTPNNTFPIYWYRDKKKKINIYAPFPR